MFGGREKNRLILILGRGANCNVIKNHSATPCISAYFTPPAWKALPQPSHPDKLLSRTKTLQSSQARSVASLPLGSVITVAMGHTDADGCHPDADGGQSPCEGSFFHLLHKMGEISMPASDVHSLQQGSKLWSPRARRKLQPPAPSQPPSWLTPD